MSRWTPMGPPINADPWVSHEAPFQRPNLSGGVSMDLLWPFPGPSVGLPFTMDLPYGDIVLGNGTRVEVPCVSYMGL